MPPKPSTRMRARLRHYLSYVYTATSAGTLSINMSPDSTGYVYWHNYGFSNEVVSVPTPEPGRLRCWFPA